MKRVPEEGEQGNRGCALLPWKKGWLDGKDMVRCKFPAGRADFKRKEKRREKRFENRDLTTAVGIGVLGIGRRGRDFSGLRRHQIRLPCVGPKPELLL